MKTLVNQILFILIGISGISCVTTRSTQIQSEEIEVFMTRLPDRAYEEVALIEASGSIFHGSKSLMRTLKKQAKKENADAVVDVKFTYAPWFFMSFRTVEALAITYKDSTHRR